MNCKELFSFSPSNNKSIALVKLSNEALQCIEEYAIKGAASSFKPTIQIKDGLWIMSIPGMNNVESFSFSLSNVDGIESQGNLQCVSKPPNGEIMCLGNIETKMQIHAKNASIADTKSKIEADDKKQKKTGSSSVQREVSLRKQLLNKIFLQTMSHDFPLDDYSVPEPSSPATCLFIPPNSIRELPTISEITEQDVEMKNEEELLENSVNFSLSQNSANLQDSSSSMVITSPIEPTTETASSKTSKVYVPTVKKSRRSSEKMCKKYSKILARIEGLERSVAGLCDKENEIPSGPAAVKSHNSYSVFPNITSPYQQKKYEKYFNKTLKVCTRLEGEISLYSQYVTTLENAVGSIRKSSKLYKMLNVKLKTAYKFREQNSSHEEFEMLVRQLNLVNVLIKKYESKTENWRNLN